MAMSASPNPTSNGVDAHSTNSTPYQLASTSLVCLFAAIVTYPAESYRIKWESSFLRDYNPESEIDIIVNWKQFRVLSPFLRLILYERASNLINSGITTTIPPDIANDKCNTLEYQCLAGAIAGISQALLLAPLEAWRANQIMEREKHLSSKWSYWIHSQIARGGSIVPEERRARAFQGVGITAIREVVFNLSFFPLFHILRQRSSEVENTETALSLAMSGVIAGSLVSFTVTPFDILKSYMTNSRERW
eukprot:CAMPEP_0183766162 /NCGR_PEP_ID=MMETSP0739-20130205/11389_1 /TAXON_ID=385413 /ORGANISM="Thalassiosira miniscula, Strain CCMP1093" /LENGTH=248 /DNA_ID=CAMNT_0026004921 /DNA_START=336 /DNA_END=1079 /DNA_ORIENTATION=+